MNKPTQKAVHYTVQEGKFNFANPSEEGMMIDFKLPHLTVDEIKEMNLQTNYYVKDEYHIYANPKDASAYDVCYELNELHKQFVWSSEQPKIQKLFDYLDSIEEDQFELRLKDELELIYFEMQDLEDRKSKVFKELNQIVLNKS